MKSSLMRARWAAIGAAVAVSLGGGVVMVANAAVTGESTDLDFISIPPCRIVDTRPGTDRVGGFAGPLGPLESLTSKILVDVDDSVLSSITCEGIPTTGVKAVALNVTAVNPTAASFITLWPGDVPTRPVVSNLNFTPHSGSYSIANQVTVQVSDDAGFEGTFWVYNHTGAVHVVIDVNGYYVVDSES